MNDKRTSPSTQSIFVIPIGDEVELYLEYNGLQWSNESINEEKLRSFSENCQGIQITFLDAENGKLLLFSQKEDIQRTYLVLSAMKINVKKHCNMLLKHCNPKIISLLEICSIFLQFHYLHNKIVSRYISTKNQILSNSICCSVMFC